MITTQQAATIAKRHGLTLSDAAALQRLSNTTEEAEEAAGMFSPIAPQLTRADLAGMSPDEINAALEAGQLSEIQGIKS